jgi:hypothetical protein
MYVIQHLLVCLLVDSTVSEDAGIEPNTVTTLALAVGHSYHSATSHPRKQFCRVFSVVIIRDLSCAEAEVLPDLRLSLCPYDV